MNYIISENSRSVLELVIVRHGESVWNQENRFTGWKDVDLSEKGIKEAQNAGKILALQGFQFDIAYTSVLTRAIKTLNYILDALHQNWLPVIKNWRLNERHYGDLTGLNKAETAAKHGEDQVKIWRRSYDTPPPMMSIDNPEHPTRDLRYQNEDPKNLPSGESLKTTAERFLPYWNSTIWPSLQQGQKVLVVAHGNSLRALIQHLEKLTPEEIMEVNVPTGVPIAYELDQNMKVISKKFIGDEATIAEAMKAVANQGKKQ